MPVAIVTGANGFIGRHLCTDLVHRGWKVFGLCRTLEPFESRGEGVVWTATGDLSRCPEASLARLCDGVDTIFHLAGRAHRADAGRSITNAEAYRTDNVDATSRLYDAAAERGVSRFVYLSSIKVLGDVSVTPFKPDAPLAPQDVYASSKCQAETMLADRAAHSIPVSTIRPPLVYGAGVAGNVAALLRWIDRGWPVPLGAANSPRSFVNVHNLTDLLVRLPGRETRYEVLHVRDAEDVSVRELTLTIGRALGKTVRLMTVPPGLIKRAAGAIGRGHTYSSLFESLCVDDSATRDGLGWQPPIPLERAIGEMGEWWRTR